MLRSRYLLHRVPDLKAKLCKGVRYSLRCVLMVKEGSANLGRNQLNWLLLTGNNLRYSFVFFMQMSFSDILPPSVLFLHNQFLKSILLRSYVLFTVKIFQIQPFWLRKLSIKRSIVSFYSFISNFIPFLIDLFPTRTSVTKR